MIYHDLLSLTKKLPTESKLFLLLLSVFAQLKAVILILVFFVLLNMFTSIYYQILKLPKASCFSQRINDIISVIDSHKLRHTVNKLLFYILALFAFYLFDVFLLKIKPLDNYMLVTFSLTNLASLLICISELSSIATNISKITGNPIFLLIMRIFSKKVDERLNINQNPDLPNPIPPTNENNNNPNL